ncbi:hypothetical protein ACLB2K_042782 [Fragaria x ananassa]
MSHCGSALGKISMIKRTRAGHLALLPCKVNSLRSPSEVNSLRLPAKSTRFPPLRGHLASLPRGLPRFASMRGLFLLLMDLIEMPLGWNTSRAKFILSWCILVELGESHSRCGTDDLLPWRAIVGDITPSDNVPKKEKSRMEAAALNEMCIVLGGGMRAEEIKELWEEYENNSSVEANLVKDFDKVEMILQALEYEMEHRKELDEFFISTAGKFQTDLGKSWAAEIISRRNTQLGKSQN